MCIKCDVADPIATDREYLSLVQVCGKREPLFVGRMDNVLKRCGIGHGFGSAAERVVIQRQHSDGVIDRLARVAGNADYLAEKIGDIGMIGAPLYIVYAITRVQRLQGQFQVFLLGNHRNRRYRTVGIM